MQGEAHQHAFRKRSILKVCTGVEPNYKVYQGLHLEWRSMACVKTV